MNVLFRFWTAWLHARRPVSLGPLEYVFTSPAMHHLHHEQRGARNYGGMFSIFDWLGKSAAKGERLTTCGRA
jgi:sterol desaturase/sphingolipid hydroxylase (fatty acid hydroxylase superfamily)